MGDFPTQDIFVVGQRRSWRPAETQTVELWSSALELQEVVPAQIQLGRTTWRNFSSDFDQSGMRLALVYHFRPVYPRPFTATHSPLSR